MVGCWHPSLLSSFLNKLDLEKDPFPIFRRRQQQGRCHTIPVGRRTVGAPVQDTFAAPRVAKVVCTQPDDGHHALSSPTRPSRRKPHSQTAIGVPSPCRLRSKLAYQAPRGRGRTAECRACVSTDAHRAHAVSPRMDRATKRASRGCNVPEMSAADRVVVRRQHVVGFAVSVVSRGCAVCARVVDELHLG